MDTLGQGLAVTGGEVGVLAVRGVEFDFFTPDPKQVSH
jgi:hypothetical protein